MEELEFIKLVLRIFSDFGVSVIETSQSSSRCDDGRLCFSFSTNIKSFDLIVSTLLYEELFAHNISCVCSCLDGSLEFTCIYHYGKV